MIFKKKEKSNFMFNYLYNNFKFIFLLKNKFTERLNLIKKLLNNQKRYIFILLAAIINIIQFFKILSYNYFTILYIVILFIILIILNIKYFKKDNMLGEQIINISLFFVSYLTISLLLSLLKIIFQILYFLLTK